LFLPWDVAIDALGVLYVSDHGNQRIEKFSLTGSFLGHFFSWDFQSPGFIATDKHGNLFVSSPDGHNISKISSGGILLTSWGSQGSGDGHFEVPSGIAVDTLGTVFVSDSVTQVVQRFTSDGFFLGALGDGLRAPRGIELDQAGNLYVSNADDRIQKYTNTGAVLSEWGTHGAGDGEFSLPAGIAAFGRSIYIAESGNHRVQVFNYPVSILPTQWSAVKTRYR